MASIQAVLPFLAFVGFLFAQNSAPSDPYKRDVDTKKLVELQGLKVSGTRLPANSIIRLSGLRVGQMVNYDILKAACAKITATGLVSAIDFAYNVETGTSGDSGTPGDSGKQAVVVSLLISDEMPLLPAKIQPPEEADQIWACLQSADPIFTRELPNTNAALLFYTANIDRCLQNTGQRTRHATANVACDGRGRSIEIVFNTHTDRAPRQTSKRRLPAPNTSAFTHGSPRMDSGTPAAP